MSQDLPHLYQSTVLMFSTWITGQIQFHIALEQTLDSPGMKAEH